VNVAGIKHDQDKIRYDLIPLDALTEIAKVLTHGVGKYGERNWEGGMSWGRYIRATMHHLFKFAVGEDRDPDSGYTHLACAGCNILFLIAYQLRGIGDDNRSILPQDILTNMEDPRK
jgi:hypothetical protein